MKKVGNHNSNSRKMFLSLALMLAFSFSSFAQDAAPAAETEAAPAAATAGGDPVKGKALFNSNCAACHKLDAKSTGPALRNIDSLVFVKWMIDKNHKIDSTKIEKLSLDYHRTKFKDFINEDNLTLLIDYCSRTRY